MFSVTWNLEQKYFVILTLLFGGKQIPKYAALYFREAEKKLILMYRLRHVRKDIPFATIRVKIDHINFLKRITVWNWVSNFFVRNSTYLYIPSLSILLLFQEYIFSLSSFPLGKIVGNKMMLLLQNTAK